MKRISAIAGSIALVAAATGAMVLLGTGKERPPESASPPPAEASFAASAARATTPAEFRDAPPTRNEQIALAIERALVARNPHQRETAFAFLVPELIELDPDRIVAMVARQEQGETRIALRDEVVRAWIVRDRAAAVEWLSTFEDEGERKACAMIAMRTLAASSPPLAIEVADQFAIGRGDGSLEHLVQIWATEKPEEAMRWIDTQPPADPRTAQLRARIDLVRAQADIAR